MLSVATRRVLTRAGWHEGRRIEIDKYVAAFKANGHPLDERVLEFLREFGGLVLRYPHFRVKSEMDGCDFFADDASLWKRQWLREYERHVGKTLVPIGHAFSRHMTLVMSADGDVFAFYEDCVCLVGHNGEEALNALCEGKELECSYLDEEECAHAGGSAIFLETTRQRLTEAGWTDDRKVDVSLEAAELSDRGFSLSPAAKAFLEEFGRLRIKTESGAEIHVSVSDAIASLEPHQVQELASQLNMPELTPVATMNPGNLVILYGTQGQAIGIIPETPDWVLGFGETAIDSINAMVSSTGSKRLR